MKHETSALPAEIAAILDGVPKTSQAMLERIDKANQKLENDPDFLADVERSKFVNLALAAMEEKQINRSELARRIGKSRQYVQKLLDEDARVSFTLKTITNVLFALDKRLKLTVEDANPSEVCESLPLGLDLSAFSLQVAKLPNDVIRNARKLLSGTMAFDSQAIDPVKQDEDRLPLSA